MTSPNATDGRIRHAENRSPSPSIDGLVVDLNNASLSSSPSSQPVVPSMDPHMFEQVDNQVLVLRQQIVAAENQLRDLRSQLSKAQEEAQAARDVAAAYRGGVPLGWIDETFQVLNQYEQDPLTERQWPLAAQEYTRYGRQLIMPQVGLFGQLSLKKAKVLVVGLGGLGCPAAAYLCGAGVGTVGLVDGDKVELSNLHRQIAHSTLRVGMSKVDSAYEYLNALNPNVKFNRYRFHLTPNNAVQMIDLYDLVLDCTDHPTSRYLISDGCVLTGKPLVTASALKSEGQLMVLNNPPRPPGDALGGPCYRCIFPKPPPPDSVLSCGEGGILGPVVGIMGVLQALEAIKVITGHTSTTAASPTPDTPISNASSNSNPANNTSPKHPERPTLTMFSAYSVPPFRTVRLRGRRMGTSNDPGCAVCAGTSDGITREAMMSGLLDYVAFCGTATSANVLPENARISASDFADLRPDGSHVLIDVRDATQFTICALRGSVNVPWTGNADTWLQQAVANGALAEDGKKRYLVCRYGNDSQLAARAIIDQLGDSMNVMDIRGGFQAWKKEVDKKWPDY